MTTERGQINAGQLIALTIALVIGVSLIGVLIPIVTDNSGTVTVTNETVTQSLEFNRTYDLNGFDIVSGSETVYHENGSAGSFEVLDSSEYTIELGPGTINVTGDGVVESSDAVAGDEVQITYDYQATDTTVETILDLLALFLALILLVALSGPIQERL